MHPFIISYNINVLNVFIYHILAYVIHSFESSAWKLSKHSFLNSSWILFIHFLIKNPLNGTNFLNIGRSILHFERCCPGLLPELPSEHQEASKPQTKIPEHMPMSGVLRDKCWQTDSRRSSTGQIRYATADRFVPASRSSPHYLFRARQRGGVFCSLFIFCMPLFRCWDGCFDSLLCLHVITRIVHGVTLCFCIKRELSSV